MVMKITSNAVAMFYVPESISTYLYIGTHSVLIVTLQARFYYYYSLLT